MSKLHQIFCASYLWPWFGPPLAALQYVMHFRFSGWRHILPILDPMAQVTQVASSLKWLTRGSTDFTSLYTRTNLPAYQTNLALDQFKVWCLRLLCFLLHHCQTWTCWIKASWMKSPKTFTISKIATKPLFTVQVNLGIYKDETTIKQLTFIKYNVPLFLEAPCKTMNNYISMSDRHKIGKIFTVKWLWNV